MGWKLAFVVKNHARASLLDTYEAERPPIAEQVIWAASSLHEIFMGHGKDIAERAQKIRDPVFLEAVVGRCSGISYTYRDQTQPPSADAGPRSATARPTSTWDTAARCSADAPLVVHAARAAGARGAAGGAASESQGARQSLCRRARAARVVLAERGAGRALRRERRRSVAAAATRRLCRLSL